MYQLCKYSKYFKCNSCGFLQKRTCKNFLVAHAKFLSRGLGDFTYLSAVKIQSDVIWSTDKNKIKSALLRVALKKNKEVTKYTISQVMHLVLQQEEITGDVVYIELNERVIPDIEKLKGIITSFCDIIRLSGGFVGLYIKSTLNIKLEECKL